MARCPFAIFRGPIVNMTRGGMVHPVRGLVLHVEEGSEFGSDGWFHNPLAQASAHFGVGKDGTLHQWLDTDDKAWAEAMGNPFWWSVETEGRHTEPLTDAQISTLSRLYGWLASLPDRIPVAIADTTSARGFGWHGMGGLAWGGHFDCPGDLRRAQRLQILAGVNAAPAVIQPSPHASAPAPPSSPPVRVTINGEPRMIQTVQVPIDTNGNGKTPTDVPVEKLSSLEAWGEGTYKGPRSIPLNENGKVTVQVVGHTPSAPPPADPWWAAVIVTSTD